MKHADVVATQALGLPAGQVVVWLLDALVLVDPVPAQVAIAIGTLIGGAIQFIKVRYYDEKFSQSIRARR